MKLVVTTAQLMNLGDKSKALWTVMGGGIHAVANLSASEVMTMTPAMLQVLASLNAVSKGVAYDDEAMKSVLVDWSVLEDSQVDDGDIEDLSEEETDEPPCENCTCGLADSHVAGRMH